MNTRRIVLLLFAVALLGGYLYWQYGRGILTAVRPPDRDIAALLPHVGDSPDPVTTAQPLQDPPAIPLKMPAGVRLSLWADAVPGARVLVQDGQGNYWVSQPREGTISLLEVQNGVVTATHVVLRDLQNPHGLALHPQDPLFLYIAEEDKISRVHLYSEDSFEKIADLPGGGGHFTRTIAFGPDERLYVSAGSSCNVCVEDDPRRATIFSMRADGSDVREVARGLRNAVFFAWKPATTELWTTEMGRDLLGDNLPPDEVNVIAAPGAATAVPEYGWPYCYGQNVRDERFNADRPLTCREPEFLPSRVDLPAHSAPLGLAFIPTVGWPAEWQGDVIVAYHGSWNRTVPTGYKLVRVKLSPQGAFEGLEDFVTGWLTENGEVLGRPVAVQAASDGALYVTDDKAGVIYKIEYVGN